MLDQTPVAIAYAQSPGFGPELQQLQARFRFRNDEERQRAKAMLGHADETRVYRTEDLASGDNLVFAATGVRLRRMPLQQA